MRGRWISPARLGSYDLVSPATDGREGGAVLLLGFVRGADEGKRESGENGGGVFFLFFFDDDDYGDKGCLLFSKGSVGGFVLFQGRMGFLSIKNNFRGFVFFQGSLGFSSIKNNLFRVLL